MNKRLEMLEKMTASGQADAFAWYGLAMEYRRLARTDDALAAFESLRALDAQYLAQYLMAGQLLLEAERVDEARPWLEQGMSIARSKGDAKALGELEQALAGLTE
jgi:tetratricopeptide (TPR) repeat protein